MEITMTPALHSRPVDADHALGDLIKLLAMIAPSGEPLQEIPFTELTAWFHDRFQLQPGACSAKALGDAMAFAIRHGLITMGKVSRGKAKITTYTGIDVPVLDAALARWSEPGAYPILGTASAPPAEGRYDDDVPEAPWDAGIEKTYGPADFLEAMEEGMELKIQDMYPEGIPDNERF